MINKKWFIKKFSLKKKYLVNENKCCSWLCCFQHLVVRIPSFSLYLLSFSCLFVLTINTRRTFGLGEEEEEGDPSSSLFQRKHILIYCLWRNIQHSKEVEDLGFLCVVFFLQDVMQLLCDTKRILFCFFL